MTIEVKNPNDLPLLSIKELIPTQGELKDLTEANYNKLKLSFEKHGFIFPISIWQDGDKNYLIDGHQRQRVITKEYGDVEVPVIKIPAKDIKEAAEILLKVTSQYGTITQEGLDTYIATYELPEAEIYEATHYDAISYLQQEEPEVEEDEAPEVNSEPPVSQVGVVYQLGRHRVMCGDSTDFGQVETLMNKEYASFCFTSPPYSDMRDYGGGDLSVDKIASFLTIDNCGFYAINLGLQRKDNAINRYWDTYIQIAEDRGLKLTAWNIWSKRGMGGSIANMSAMFPIEHEWIFVFGGNKENVNRTKKNKTAGLPTGISNRQKDGTTKRVKPKNVQEYGVMGSVYEGVYATGEKEHPAVYPIHLPVEYIRACTQKNDIVYDPFLGSGTNVVACEQTDRICYGIELDPKYVDVIRKRYAKFTAPDNQLPENWEELTPAIERELSETNG